MSLTLPTIVVFGATGSQGGSVINELLSKHKKKFHIRAVTRNPSSEAATKLSKQGVEVVKGDANDIPSLKAAFHNAWGTFLVTDFWDAATKLAPDTDWVQGKNMVDAALASGSVKFIVWSSLCDIDKASNKTLDCPYFTEKNRVEQYIRSKPIQSAHVYAGFYMKNWIMFPPLGIPYRDQDGHVKLDTAIRLDVALPLLDVDADFGAWVAPLFLDPARYNGAKILAATEYLRVPEMAAAYTKVTGEQVQISRVPVSSAGFAPAETMITCFNLYGGLGGEPLEPSRQLYDHLQLHTFEDWLRRTQFRAKPKQS